MVVKGTTMYFYYTYIGSDGDADNDCVIDNIPQDYTMVATADLSNENWPGALESQGVAVRKYTTQYLTDSLDVKYVEDQDKFIAIAAGDRFTTDSWIAVFESTDGLRFELVDAVRQDTYLGLHNVALSSGFDGHINLTEDADYLRVVYAYDGVGDVTGWGKWATRIQPISLGLSVSTQPWAETKQAAKPSATPSKDSNPDTSYISLRASETRKATGNVNSGTTLDEIYAVQVGNTLLTEKYAIATLGDLYVNMLFFDIITNFFAPRSLYIL